MTGEKLQDRLRRHAGQCWIEDCFRTDLFEAVDAAAENERLRTAHERALDALSQPDATNWERMQAAGLILRSAQG